MKRAGVRTAMVVTWALGMAWSPARSVGQCCGDCNGDGAVTIDELVTAVNNALGQCENPALTAAFPASGQTTAYGPGSDGAVRAGAALTYTDNGDGTITDNNTRLLWEKKDDSGGLHGQNTLYTWGMAPPSTMNGTMVTTFLSGLNTPPCFAGHCDWRIPNVKELQSIVDYEIAYPGPAVNAAFHNAAGCPGCADVALESCSCTRPSFYWSSTTIKDGPGNAWIVTFNTGGLVTFEDKSNAGAVRAVRGGL